MTENCGYWNKEESIEITKTKLLISHDKRSRHPGDIPNQVTTEYTQYSFSNGKLTSVGSLTSSDTSPRVMRIILQTMPTKLPPAQAYPKQSA